MTTSRTDPCDLCPRLCGAHRDSGERGYCGADHRLLVARAALHRWEEPPLSGSAGSGAIFFSHCPMHCVYCQNAPLASGQVGWEVSVPQLASMMLDLQDQGALNVNLVTATHYAPQVIEAVQTARAKGLKLPIVWNTSGYERRQTIDALEGIVDVYLADFKYGRARDAQRYSKASDYPEVALDALEAMVDQVGAPAYDEQRDGAPMIRGVILRHLLLPGGLEASKEALATLFHRFGNQVLYSIMNQYTPVMAGDDLTTFPELAQASSDEEYEELLDFADGLGIEDYFWQEGGAVDESFIPLWDGTGLDPGVPSA